MSLHGFRTATSAGHSGDPGTNHRRGLLGEAAICTNSEIGAGRCGRLQGGSSRSILGASHLGGTEPGVGFRGRSAFRRVVPGEQGVLK